MDDRPISPGQNKWPELVIGLVGPVGTRLDRVIHHLRHELQAFSYTPHTVRLSKRLRKFYEQYLGQTNWEEYEDLRIKELMKAGDQLRNDTGRGDIAVLLALEKIWAIRKSIKPQSEDQTALEDGHAYILNSLKHPDEIATLQKIYGNAFALLSVYSPTNVRLKELKKRIAESRERHDQENFSGEAQDILDSDSKQPGTELGQNVQDAFPLADAFLNDDETLETQLRRLIEIFFGYSYRTPTQHEQGMYFADAAALRSSDLSRQVGAVITRSENDYEILAIGCNEVPRQNGGSAWECHHERTGSAHADYRDFQEGRDYNATIKRDIIREVFSNLKKHDASLPADDRNTWLTPAMQKLTADKLAQRALSDDAGAPLKDTRLDSILEFGRAVHAEMFALTQAARLGMSVKGATLYSTAFPCHMCARHIIASGIEKVIYIQPYPKSLAKEIYSRSVSVEDDVDSDNNAVAFSPFIGISPRRYRDFFKAGKRKDRKGYALSNDKTNPSRFRVGAIFPSVYIDMENEYLNELMDIIEDKYINNGSR